MQNYEEENLVSSFTKLEQITEAGIVSNPNKKRSPERLLNYEF